MHSSEISSYDQALVSELFPVHMVGLAISAHMYTTAQQPFMYSM